jgi:hypothetical protein
VPAFRFDLGGVSESCFGDDEHAALVATEVGAGTFVAFGAPWAFTNEYLDEEGNAGLFATLVVPEPGTKVAVLVAGDDGDDLDQGDRGALGDVVPDGVLLAVAQLAAAFVVYALYRARRLGMPVAEDPPVEVAGSELVRAVGTMRQRTGERDRAGASLRRAARLRLVSRFGLPAESAPETVAATVAARTGLEAARLRGALVDGTVADDQALRALGAEIDELVTAALGPPRGAGPAVSPASDPTASAAVPSTGTPPDPDHDPDSDEELP